MEVVFKLFVSYVYSGERIINCELRQSSPDVAGQTNRILNQDNRMIKILNVF